MNCTEANYWARCVIDQSRSSAQGWIWVQRWDQSSLTRPDSDPFFLFCVENEWMRAGDGQRGDSSSPRIAAVVKPLKSPAVRGTGRSKAARFLISFLIPPDPIHPGPACCNPSVRYPSMFNMLMPPTKWMNHRGATISKKDGRINTPDPCLLVDDRLIIDGGRQQVHPVPFLNARSLRGLRKRKPHVWGCTNYILPPQRPNIKEAFVRLNRHRWAHFLFGRITISSAPRRPT